MNICRLRISIAEYPSMDIPAWISMWISTLVLIIEHWHPKITDVHFDIRGYLEIHVWICYGFLNQGFVLIDDPSLCSRQTYSWLSYKLLRKNSSYSKDNYPCLHASPRHFLNRYNSQFTTKRPQSTFINNDLPGITSHLLGIYPAVLRTLREKETTSYKFRILYIRNWTKRKDVWSLHDTFWSGSEEELL